MLHKNIWRTTAWLIFNICLMFWTQAYAQSYTIRDLGTLTGHTNSRAYALNDKGQVVGYTSNISATQDRAFLINPPYTEMINLGNYKSHNSIRARDINNKGLICGDSYGSDAKSGLLLFAGGVVISLPTPAGENIGNLRRLNEMGRVVGSMEDNGYLYFEGNLVSLPPLTGLNECEVMAINSSNVMVGWSTGSPIAPVATKWEAGQALPIIALGGSQSTATDIADNGVIVGGSQLTGNTGYHAFLLPPGGLAIDLGTLSDNTSYAHATNGTDVVGVSVVSNNNRAFVYKDGQMRNLNDLIPPNSGWTLFEAFDINAYGQICGWGEIDGNYHGFLATPNPPQGGAADWDFTLSDQGWTAATSIPPFEPAQSQWVPSIGYGLRATAFPCFAFLQSPEVTLLPGRTYRLWCTVATTAATPETAPQVRLRAFQTTTNMSEFLALDSVGDALPSFGEKTYEFSISTQISGPAQTYRFYLDYTFFNPFDDQNAWAYLKRVLLAED